MQSKKIAVIGCSHLSVHDQPSQQKNNWSYQLYKKYPQHQYRNYSKGGQGIEQFQWHLLDAKKWGADIVFLNRTYPGRWAMLTQNTYEPGYGEFSYIADDHTAESNWSEMLPKYEAFWGTVNGGIKYNRAAPDPGQWDKYDDTEAKSNLSAIEKVNPYWRLISGSHVRLIWEIEWYSNVEKLYNFPHVFLMDWSADSHEPDRAKSFGKDYRCYDHGSQQIYNNMDPEITLNSKNVAVLTSTTWELPVEEFFLHKYNLNRMKNQELWQIGIQTSEQDNHFSPRGNLELLNEYILGNEKVRDALLK